MNSSVDEWLEKGRGGYSLQQLNAAFDAVKNPEHWKEDIDSVVSAELRDVLIYAIPWFTGGTEIQFVEQPDGRLRVLAPGYWSNGMEG